MPLLKITNAQDGDIVAYRPDDGSFGNVPFSTFFAEQQSARVAQLDSLELAPGDVLVFDGDKFAPLDLEAYISKAIEAAMSSCLTVIVDDA